MIDMFFDLLNLILPFDLSLCNKYHKRKIIVSYVVDNFDHPAKVPAPVKTYKFKFAPALPDIIILPVAVVALVGVVVRGANINKSVTVKDPVTAKDPVICT
jgi:hypothetical protein